MISNSQESGRQTKTRKKSAYAQTPESEATELLIELEFLRQQLARKNIEIDCNKILDAMMAKDIRNTHEAIIDIYGDDVYEILVKTFQESE